MPAYTVDAVCPQSFSALMNAQAVVTQNSSKMNIEIDLGTVKIASANKREVDLPDGDYTFGAGCGSCTTVHGMKNGKLSFTFIPNATGEQAKTIYAYNSANGNLEHTIVFKANVVL